MKTITVEVKQKHIDEGEIESCTSCPIAKAILDIGKFEDVYVGQAGASLWHGNDLYEADLPKKARKFVECFDQREPVKPFSFQLRYWGERK